MNLDLSGRRALVTGSTKGIGLAAVLGLAKMGAHVVVNGRDVDGVNAAVAAVNRAVDGGLATGAVADLGSAGEREALFAAVPEVDILVNNVGVYRTQDFFDITDSDWNSLLEINLMSGVRLTRHYLPSMLKRGWGRVINVSSESGSLIPSEMIHYGVSKAAQLAFSRGVAELTAGTDVTVNAVLPGPTLVEATHQRFKQRALDEGVDESALLAQAVRARRPTSLARRYLDPEEVANMICYLCSPAASATNGAPVRADGGIVSSYS